MQPLDVTLYIPCFNAAPFLDRVLQAAKAQTHPIERLLVVDDGSTDDSARLAEDHGVEVIRHGANKGLAAARNTGVRAARTRYVASLDADVVARPDWLERLAENLIEDRFAGAGGNLIETRTRGLPNRWRCVHMQQGWGKERLEEPRFLFGNNTLFRRDALAEAGLYDELHRTNGEDISMSRKLRDLGQALVYDPRARCEHLREDTAESICRTFYNWTFSGETVVDGEALARIRRGSRRRLGKRILRRDLKALRLDLALFDLYMWADWRRRAARKFEEHRAGS